MKSERDNIEEWKSRVKRERDIPEEYDVVINYSHEGVKEADEIARDYMAECDQLARYMLTAGDGQVFWWQNDQIFPAITKEQHIHSLEAELVTERGAFTQEHSDALARFMQVVAILSRSSWQKNFGDICVKQCGGSTKANLPSLEDTTYALLWIRQLVSTGNDNLINKAAGCYGRFTTGPRQLYCKERQRAVNELLADNPWQRGNNPANTNREFLEAFWYGAGIIHAPGDSPAHDNYKAIYLERHNKELILHDLHFLLQQILQIVSEIEFLIRKDYARWIHEGQAPRPEVHWLETMFSWEELDQEEHDAQ